MLALATAGAKSAPITSRESVLPPATELNQELLDKPTERFASELAGGKRPYLVNFGDLLFSSPDILGGVARQAGIAARAISRATIIRNYSFPACRAGPARSIRPMRCSSPSRIMAFSTR
jgi:hypothetical protein